MVAAVEDPHVLDSLLAHASPRPDQAVALRRRRLRGAPLARCAAEQHARRDVFPHRAGGGFGRLGRRCGREARRLRRDGASRRSASDRPPAPGASPRRPHGHRPGGRADEPVAAGGRPGARVPQARPAGAGGRVPRQRSARAVPGPDPRAPGAPRCRRHARARRDRGGLGGDPEGRPLGTPRAALRHPRAAGAPGRPPAAHPRPLHAALRLPAHGDRGRGTRLSVQLLVLLDHQRAGKEDALPRPRRDRTRRARELEARHRLLLLHRRQLLAQSVLGGGVRRPHPAARGGGGADRFHDAGGRARVEDPALHREGGARRQQPGVPRHGVDPTRQPEGGGQDAEQGGRVP